VRLRALADTPDAFGSTLEEERHHGQAEWLGWILGWEGATNRLFVATDRDEWLGLAVGSRTGDDPVANVYSMWVDASVRRTGIGRRLLDEVVEWSRSIGVNELELAVTSSNRGAVRFYGFPRHDRASAAARGFGARRDRHAPSAGSGWSTR
jgi:GNAT superfamily N-acetyltransferase